MNEVSTGSGSDRVFNSIIGIHNPPATAGGTDLISLTILPGLGQIIIDHPAPVLLRFSDRRIAAFFITADLVFGVETFEREFAGGHCLRFVLTVEIKGNQSRVDQVGRG